MKIKERLRRDKEVLAELDRQGKLLFLWDYYKIPILAAVCVLALALITIATSAGSRPKAMYAVLVNTAGSPGDREMLDRLLSEGGVDMAGRQVDVMADLRLGRELDDGGDAQTVQVLAALFGISGLDLFAADMPVFERYASQGAFADLSLLIDRQVLERHKDDLYYCQTEDGRTVLSGIALHAGSPLHEAGYYLGDVVVGVAASAQNMEEAVILLRQLL